MVMRLAVGNLERDDDLRKKCLERERFEIRPRIEAQPIDAWRRRARVRHQRPLSPIGIRLPAPDDLPFRFMLALEHDADAGGRNTTGGIEDVGSDRAHETPILALSSRRRSNKSRPDEALRNAPSSTTTSPLSIVLWIIPLSCIPAYGVIGCR